MFKNIFRGRKIWQSNGLHHPFFIFENRHYRWLTFGSESIQTAMDKQNPERLVLDYLDTMMGIQYFLPNPKSILLLGYGGGALVKNFLTHWPTTPITAVDIEPELFRISENYFHVPIHSPMLTLEKSDAFHYLKTLKKSVDWLIIDLFHSHKMPIFTRKNDFWENCRRCLNENGVLALNIITQHNEEFQKILEVLRTQLDSQTLVVGVPGFRNMIVFCSHSPNFRNSINEMMTNKILVNTAWNPALGLHAEKLNLH